MDIQLLLITHLIHTLWSDNLMFIGNIDPIETSGVSTVGGKNFITKVLLQFSGSIHMMKGNCIKRTLKMYLLTGKYFKRRLVEIVNAR